MTLFLVVLYSCSSQKTYTNSNPLKLISGEIFPEANDQIIFTDTKVQVKGAEKERFTTPDPYLGSFQIEVRKGEILIISYLHLYKEVKITDENTYIIMLTDNKVKTKTGKIPH